VGRRKKTRCVSDLPNSITFVPIGKWKPRGEISLPVEGYEAIRLADYLGLHQNSAAREMGISRATFGRILKEARKTVAEAIMSGETLKVRGGSYIVYIRADSLEIRDE